MTRLNACGRPLGILVIALGLLATPGPRGQAQAQTAADEVVEGLARDITAVSVNTPVWLAQHLPAMMGQSGIGAGVDLTDEAGRFSLGIFPIRLGVMNQFSQVGRGTKLIDLESSLPGNMIWPQFGITLGVGLGSGFELSGDFQFIPDTDLALGEGITIDVGTILAAGALRWRINKAKGAMPAFVLGVAGSYYSGHMDIGAGFQKSYTYDTGFGMAEGTYTFLAAPVMAWRLWQVGPELRVGWKAGPVRPFMGFGFAYTGGTVTGGAEVKARATVDTVDGQPVNEEVLHEELSEVFDTKPAAYVFRPHAGIDFVIGIFALSLQLDLAVLTQESLSSSDLGNAADSFDPSDDFLFNEAAKSSQTSATLVFTTAFRFQF